jgi:hypothetical protein
MSVNFTGAGSQSVKWTGPTNALGHIAKTLRLSYYHNADPAGSGLLFDIFDGAGTDSDEYNYLIADNSTPLKLSFLAHFSTTNGLWRSTNNVLSVGSWHDIILTYDGSNVANNASLYIDGVNKPLTRVTAPVGTYRTGTNSDIYIGITPDNFTLDGKIEDLRIYNVVKTSDQIAVLAAEDIFTSATIDESDLVFHAPLVMAKGLTYATYAGATLAAGNEFFDRVNGYTGVPSGSPVGA